MDSRKRSCPDKELRSPCDVIKARIHAQGGDLVTTSHIYPPLSRVAAFTVNVCVVVIVV